MSIFVLLILVIGLVVGLILSQKRRRVLVLAGGLATAVVMVVFFSHFGTVRAPQYVADTTPPWTVPDEMLTNVSVYPSAESAARVVGASLAKDIALRTETMRPAGMLVIGPASQPIRAAIASKIADACRFLRLAESVPANSAAPTTRPADYLIVTVDDVQDLSGRGERMLQATADIPHMGANLRSAGANVYYENKPWAEKPQGFHQLLPNKPFLVAWSDGLGVSMDEAIAQARRNAARMMLPRVWQRMQVERPGQRFDNGQIRSEIEGMIAERLVSQDQFTQEISRGYGKLWRAAIRVDTSNSVVATLAGRIGSRQAAAQRFTDSHIKSVAVLLVLILVIYLALNAITKGYFSKGLQIGAIIALLIGLVALMLIA